jgi:hypothetical protein
MGVHAEICSLLEDSPVQPVVQAFVAGPSLLAD